MERIDDIKQKYNQEVHVKWECEFRDELSNSPEMKKLYEDIYILPHLNHRVHTLRGGRTEPFEFKYKCGDDEQILLLDIVSSFGYR